MINHGRTLLLNLAPDVNNTPGEEYVPPDFAAQVLSADLSKLRTILFGNDADRAMCNYRLRQVLFPIHASELAGYLTNLDSRITYWPPHDDRLFRALAFGASAKQTVGSGNTLYFQGNVDSFTAPGRIVERWGINVLNATDVQVDRFTAPASSAVVTYTVSGGLSSNINLPGSNLSVKFAAPAIGAVWEIAGLAKPTYELNDAYSAMKDQGTPAILFSGASEPYVTFRKLWYSDKLPVTYRISGWVLALIYRLNDSYVLSS